MRSTTGIKRLDELLNGGIPSGNTSVIYGPPFIGKEVLAKLFFLEGLRRGIPGILTLTAQCATDVRAELATIDAAYPEYESKGLANFVDAYSRSIGADEPHPLVEYVENLMDLNAMSIAVNTVQSRIVPKHANHRLILDSASTLVAYSNPQTTFRFLQILVGKAKRAGATTMLLLDDGMHTNAEVQTFKHLSNGIIELKAETPKYLIRVSGLGVTANPGWIEYQFSPTALEITGSFSAGRIH